jgi:UDP-glucuronate 4-epimerase
MSQPRTLVTGGAGFIGSHLAEALLERGHSLAIVDNLDDFYSPSLKRRNLREVSQRGKVSVYESDIRDLAALRAVFERERPETVLHIAARAGVRPSIEQPRLYEEVNVAGTLNLLLLARSFGVRKFVFASSSSIYGATATVPFREDHVEMKPISPYAATKLAGELLCYTYSHLYHLPVVCLRLFTVYGPRQRPDLAIRKFTALMAAGKPIPIFGDGTSSRDYTYIDDIVAGVVAAMDYQTDFEVFNLGNSQAVRLLDLVRLLEEVTGKRAVLDHQPLQAGDVNVTWAEVSKARRLLGYEPRTQLASGLKKFWRWYRDTAKETSSAGESG